jgi:Cys-tRNA(Pro)/Cys-tRNA(Cys) deacylase
MKEEPKTNAMRILDQHKVPYEVHTYECQTFVDGIEAAKAAGVPDGLMYKTLVAQGKSERYSVFVLPVAAEMDMKKAARAVEEKSVDLIPVKDINRITGYVRGGCSPLGIKRVCRIVIDISAEKLPAFYISGGRIGCIISADPKAVAEIANAKFEDLVLGAYEGK